MFKKILLGNILIVTLFSLSFSSTAQKISVPSYFYPYLDSCDATLEENEAACNWKNLNSASDTVSIAIINPDNGVGLNNISNYKIQTQETQAKNIKVLGYIATDYAKEKEEGRVKVAKDHLDANKKEIDLYIERYDVDGFFFDEASTDCESKG